jgi:NAD-dependent SIR2 family protein deacetylase
VGIWWKWDEYCNKCGKQTKKYDRFSSITEPKIGEDDYCNECLRKGIDDTIVKK